MVSYRVELKNSYWIGLSFIKMNCWKTGSCVQHDSSLKNIAFAIGIYRMYWDVIEVISKSNFSLIVCFEDGTRGQVRFEQDHFTGVFEPLKEAAFFSRVFIDSGAVAWPGDIDIAPDAMYREIKRCGEWLLK
jgi:hypothetical protein